MPTPSTHDNNDEPRRDFASRGDAEAPLPASLLRAVGSVDYAPLLERADRMPGLDELWRLSWEGTSHLGIIGGATAEGVEVRPVLVDSEPDDDRCLYASALGIGWDELLVVIDLSFNIPSFVLDAQVGNAPLAVHDGSWVRGSDSAEVVDDVIDDFRAFETASWWETGSYRVVATADELITHARITPRRVMELLEGAVPTDAEATAIKSSIGAGALEVEAASPQIVRLLDEPVYKARIVEWSSVRRISEAAGRRRLADQVPGVAARGASSSAARLRAALSRVLADGDLE